jgi:hypothetical protein
LHEGPTIVDAWPISSIATTLIEFSDFQRPFCERFYRETLPLIDRDYIRTGKVRMVYRDFPLVDVRKDAQKAAETAQCAGEHGKYWEMHHKIFANYTTMSVDDLKNHARGLDIAAFRFDRCPVCGIRQVGRGSQQGCGRRP